MLLEFRVSNYRSFRDEQTFSLVPTIRDHSHENANVVRKDGHRILKSAAVYGANAGGKSNLVKAFGAVKEFVATSATQMTLGDKIDVEPFRLQREYADRPTEFRFALLLDGVRYDYGFSATAERVHDEWITAYPKGVGQRWLERFYHPDAEEYEWKCRGPLAREKRGLIARTRQNGLALARGAERNIDELAPLFLWFKEKLRVLDQSTPPEALDSTMRYSMELFRENSEFGSYVRGMIADADLGIAGLGVEGREISESDLPRDLPHELRDRILSKLGKEGLLTWVLTHLNRDTGEAVRLSPDDEAAGTLRLLALSGPWWYTLQHGYTLVVDELDCSLHPHLVRKLVQVFQSPAHNRSGAQLIFVTHDSTLMDRSLVRRDQIWLVEKERNGASRMFSLWDVRETPRKTEAIQRGYLGGRYGGVPSFGATLEEVD